MLANVTHVWHYWIAVVLTISAVGLLLALVAGYVKSVVRTRFPQKPT